MDSVFSEVLDIAGVRVATYVESDRERVVALVRREFKDVVVERHDKDRGYNRATHCQVTLPAPEAEQAPGELECAGNAR